MHNVSLTQFQRLMKKTINDKCPINIFKSIFIFDTKRGNLFGVWNYHPSCTIRVE